MVKPKYNNGFTLLEVLFVMLVLSILSLAIVGTKGVSSLSIFMENMMSYSVLTQEKAFIDKQRKLVNIYENYAVFDQEIFKYPQSITCQPASFHYNDNGNISRATSVTCQDDVNQKRLIFQLGSGRARIE